MADHRSFFLEESLHDYVLDNTTAGDAVDASLSAAPSSRKNASSSSTPAGMLHPRRERRVDGKQLIDSPLANVTSVLNTSTTCDVSMGDRVR